MLNSTYDEEDKASKNESKVIDAGFTDGFGYEGSTIIDNRLNTQKHVQLQKNLSRSSVIQRFSTLQQSVDQSGLSNPIEQFQHTVHQASNTTPATVDGHSAAPIQRVLLGSEQNFASHGKYKRFFDDYAANQEKTYDLQGDRLNAFVAFLDCVAPYWDMEGVPPDSAYYWFTYYLSQGVYTRDQFREAFADAGFDDHGYDVTSDPDTTDGSAAEEVVQQKRNPGPSGPKNYPGFADMLFMKTTPNATIDFNSGLANSSSKQNNKAGSLVDLNTLITANKVNDTVHDPHKGKTVRCPRAGQNFSSANRDQHFALADMIYYLNHGAKPDRTGTWTWHHLETPYQMVLVNMLVHSKHGHNGGVYLWP